MLTGVQFVIAKIRKKHADQKGTAESIVQMVSRRMRKDATYANANLRQAPPPLHVNPHPTVHPTEKAKVIRQGQAEVNAMTELCA